VMVMEPAAITCRVASSFIRVGHIDLFARRVRGEVPGIRGAVSIFFFVAQKYIVVI
jgi:hypothetical protein